MSDQNDIKHSETMAFWGTLWWWGTLLLFAPVYLHIGGGWGWFFNVIGLVAVTFSFCAALIDHGSFRKSETYNYLGVGLVFIIPAIVLHLELWRHGVRSPWDIIAKIAVLFLLAIGGVFVVFGLTHIVWRQTTEHASDRVVVRRGSTWKVWATTLIALLSLLTAVLKFASTFREPAGPNKQSTSESR